MIRFPLFLLTLLIFVSSCKGEKQPVAVEVKEKKSSNNQYKDFAYAGDKIWALTTNGKLSLFEPNTGDPISDKVKNNSVIIILANDKEGNIIIGDKRKAIKKYDKQTQSCSLCAMVADPNFK